MGRPRKLPVLERLDGNPTKRPIEPVGIEAYGRPYVPEHLSDDARGYFEVVLTSMPVEVYSLLDTAALAAFCQLWANVKRLQFEMAKPDFRLFDDDGNPNPCLAEHRKEATAMATMGAQLGLTPAARAKLKLPKANQQKPEFDGLIGRRISSSSANGFAYRAE